ncbi:tetratricopeptide repeat protein [Parasediminibacterium sp. JCM 36343]|uniref:tetratricopeptide repeat protein n=1 Tax=Parasediminibacterium sp. JCM 36343 TaxID=3374279 RepID=UPI00397A4DD6
MLNRENLIRRADLLRKQKRFKDAEREIGMVLQSDPEDVEALLILAHCKLDTRLFDEAIDILNQCLHLDSSNDYVFYLMAFAWYQKNDNKKALGFLNEALSIFPYNAGYFALAAHIRLEQKEYQLALEAADYGLALDAESVSCLNMRSTALFRLNKKDEAYETINEALAIDPENFTTHANYGWHYLEKGKHKQAAEHFREALRINPNYGYAKDGYKAALKSKLVFYRWLLQYNLWMNKQTKNIRLGVLLGVWFAVRVLASASKDSKFQLIGIVVMWLYFVLVMFSWLGSSFANLYLLFTPHGRYILTHNEQWRAKLVSVSMFSGLVSCVYILLVNDNYLFIPLVIASTAIIFNEMEYPIQLAKSWGRPLLSQLQLLVAVVCCIAALINLNVAMGASIFYAALFVAYIWSGSLRNTF